MQLPYTRLIRSCYDDGEVYYYGRIAELDGCQSTAETLGELDDSLNEAMELYIETLIQLEKPVPEPKEFNGRVLFRMPSDLHRRLYYEALEQGISLNQYGLSKLAK